MIGLCKMAPKPCAILLGVTGWVGGLAGILGAQNPPARELAAGLRQTLEQGDFAAARRLAQQVEDPRQQSQALSRIARAQVAAQRFAGAWETSALVADDRLRAETLTHLRHQLHAARGGGQQADFDALLDLIETTVAPDTWEAVGGEGSMAPFPGGVLVDAQGLLRQRDLPASVNELPRKPTLPQQVPANAPVQRAVPLRKVSLRMLERQMQLLWAAGRQPTESMQFLAGLERVQYVFVYPDQGDVVIAGPASGWTRDAQGRVVSRRTGRPVLRADDLVVLLRGAMTGKGQFGCSITPTREKLAQAQDFLARHRDQPLAPGKREAWLEELRQALGRQVITVHGVPASSQVAQVLVEADYHMKLIGIGLQPSVEEVPSYLQRIQSSAGQPPPPLGVLRWWFTLADEPLKRSPAGDVFVLQSHPVQLLSENELLTRQGERIHTGKADLWNRQFAQDFTDHFAALAERYPVYAELENVFTLALVAALMQQEDLPAQLDWPLCFWLDSSAYVPAAGHAPQEVMTVMNYRLLHRKHLVAAVSGGVICNPPQLFSGGLPQLSRQQVPAKPPEDAEPLGVDAWWWD